MNYEGSQSRVTLDLSDENYYNNQQEEGWYIEKGNTDLQKASEMEFKEKEGKWFSYMKGDPVIQIKDLDSREFSFQGIGMANDITLIPNGTNGGGSDDCSNVNISVTTWTTVWSLANGGAIGMSPTLFAQELPYTVTVIGDNTGTSYPSTGSNDPNYGGGGFPATEFINLPIQPYTVTITTAGGCTQVSTLDIVDPGTYGCTDPSAINYDTNATIDDGTCIYTPPPANMWQMTIQDLGDQD